MNIWDLTVRCERMYHIQVINQIPTPVACQVGFYRTEVIKGHNHQYGQVNSSEAPLVLGLWICFCMSRRCQDVPRAHQMV